MELVTTRGAAVPSRWQSGWDSQAFRRQRQFGNCCVQSWLLWLGAAAGLLEAEQPHPQGTSAAATRHL